MADWLIRTATEADAEALAPRLRTCDAEEIAAGTGEPVLDVLRASVGCSRFTWAALRDGQVVLLLGTADGDGFGVPWMLGAEGVERWGGALTKIARAHIALVKQFYPGLKNYVHVANARSVRWLARLGFEIHPPEPFGPQGAPFHPFTMGL